MLPSIRMSAHLLFTYGLWVGAVVLQIAITVRMYLKRVIREFPCFSIYTVEHILRAIVLFLLSSLPHHSYTNYFYGYWTAEAIDVVLGIAVIYEIYSHVFREYEALQRLGNVLFQWSAAMLFLAAVTMAAVTHGSDASKLMAAIMVAEQCFSFLRAGLLLLLFVFARTFGLTWRHYVFGIALGFAVYVSVDMVVAAIRGNLGSVANATYTVVKTSAYNCSVVIWTVYFLQRKPNSVLVKALPTSDLENWNNALLYILNR